MRRPARLNVYSGTTERSDDGKSRPRTNRNSRTANATGTGGAPKLSAAAAAAAAAEQSHARALAAAKSQQRILAHPVKPAAPMPLPQMTLKKSNSNTFPTQRSARSVLALVTEEAKKSVFEARKRWQLAGAALQGQVSEDVLKTDPSKDSRGRP